MDTPVELLRRAGFVDVTELDGTDKFRAVAKAWIDQWDEHRDALTALYGEPSACLPDWRIDLPRTISRVG